MTQKILSNLREIFHHAGIVIHESFLALKNSPWLVMYPATALGVFALTLPIVSAIVIPLWHKTASPGIITDASQRVPHPLASHVGLVVFSAYYLAFVFAYFNCAITGDVLAKLQNESRGTFDGLFEVKQRFGRVTKFAILSVFFFPLSIIAQRRKLRSPRGFVEVIGGSLSLSTTQLAPAILHSERGVMDSIRYSVDTLGKAWRENLVIRGGLYAVIFLLASISFLPKLIQSYWFDGHTAHVVGIIFSGLLGLAGYTAIRILGIVFTSVLYYHAKHNK